MTRTFLIAFALASTLVSCRGEPSRATDEAVKSDVPAPTTPAPAPETVAAPEVPATSPARAPLEAVVPTPGTLLLVTEARGEILGSDERALERAAKWLEKDGTKVERRAAEPAETSFVDGAGPEAKLPPAWAKHETVAYLTLAAPLGQAPKRFSGGRSRLLVFQPPLATPVFSLVHDSPASSPLDGEALGKFLNRHVALRREGK